MAVCLYRMASGSENTHGPAKTTAKTIHKVTPAADIAPNWQSFTVDLRNIPNFRWSDRDNEITLSLFTGSDAVDMEILYFAAFKSEAEATAFNISNYRTFVSDKNNAILATINYQPVTDSVINGYMAEVEVKKQEILNAKDINPSTIKGTCYYISSVSGNDDNDGLSPDTPWKSIGYIKSKRVTIQPILKYGVTPFSLGGSEFYAGEIVFAGHSKDGVHFACLRPQKTYAAYGGLKPLFTNAVKFDDGTKPERG